MFDPDITQGPICSRAITKPTIFKVFNLFCNFKTSFIALNLKWTLAKEKNEHGKRIQYFFNAHFRKKKKI